MFDGSRSTAAKVTAILTTALFAAVTLSLSLSSTIPRSAAEASSSAAVESTSWQLVGQGDDPVAQAGAWAFDICIRQDSDSRITFCFSSSTGDYRLTDCGKNLTFTGKGTVTTGACKIELKHSGPDPKKPDRNVSVSTNPCSKAGNATVNIFATGASYAVSDSDITNNDLGPPSVSVTTPNGGQVLFVGLPLVIAWASTDNTGVTGHDVLFSKDGGASFTPIATGLAGSVNQVSWTPPPMPDTTAAKIRVVARDAACNTGSDDSDAAFSVINDVTPPQVMVTAPNGGEIVDSGAVFTISWNATDNAGLTGQDILLSTDGGSSYSTLASGLAPGVSEFAWTAPVIPSNGSARVRVRANDIGGNAGIDDSDVSFMLWNPGVAFNHVAEASMYKVSDQVNSTIHITNTSTSPVTAEIGLRKPLGAATANMPMILSMAAGEVRAIDVRSRLTIPALDATPLSGSIRLRHNGAETSSISAVVVVDKHGDSQSFSVPLVYPSRAYAPTGGTLCAPICYIDGVTRAELALQNCTNARVPVSVKMVYGTGEPGTPWGSVPLPQFTLSAQQTVMLDLANLQDRLYGVKWGSVVVNAPPQTVVPHLAMTSPANNLAFDSRFVDPVASTNTTKVASTIKLDYDRDVDACLMVCNVSSSETRVVTVSFKTDNGVAVPPKQITLEPGRQQLIEVDSRAILTAGRATRADARISYSGSPSDIVAGAVSMSTNNGMAVPAHFVEPNASDGRRLVSPFFKTDARTAGIVQVTNLGTSPVNFGVRMKLANANVAPVTTDVISTPAGGTASINLQRYFDQTPDNVQAHGSLELFHNGQPGKVASSFAALGDGSDFTVGTPFEPVSQAGGMVVFPNGVAVQPGDVMEISAMTDGGQPPPIWTTTWGTITAQPSSEPGVFRVTFTAPDDDEGGPDTATIQVTSPNGVGTTAVEIQKVKLRSIETKNAAGLAAAGRLNPEGGSTFVLTGNREFPSIPLKVEFRQGGLRVSTDVPIDPASRPSTNQLAGTAPSNTLFVGDVQVFVLTEDGTTVSKKKLCQACDAGDADCGPDSTICSAYYAFDPPTPPTAVSMPGFNRLGGNLTITAAGGGFRRLESSQVEIPAINPMVVIGGIEFEVNTVNNTQINGNVQRAPSEITSCQVEGQVPCKRITVTNPGGRRQDRVRSNIPLYNLVPGPAPVIESFAPNTGPSIGTTGVLIFGTDLDFVRRVTFRALDVITIIRQNQDVIAVLNPPNCVGGADAAIEVFSVDNLSANRGGFRYHATAPTEVVPVISFPRLDEVFIVGGCSEAITAALVSHSPACVDRDSIRVTPVEIRLPDARLPGLASTVRAFEIKISFNSANCTGTSPRTASFDVRLTNSADTSRQIVTTFKRTF